MEKSLRYPALLGFFMVLYLISWLEVLFKSNLLILELEMFMASSLSFTISIVIDKISMSFGLVVTTISYCVFIFASSYMSADPHKYRFLGILTCFVISMVFLTLSGSIFFLLLGWDGLGITSFALIIYYQSNDSVTAGFQTLAINRIGDVLIVLSTYMFVLSGQFSFYSMSILMNSSLVLMLLLAGMTKSAQYPFSPWLPAAMAAPTPVSALVHSSTLVTAGIFLVIRLSYNFPLNPEFQSLLLFFGSITCILGGWSATFECDLKKVIALSTLSQLGIMVFSLGLGLPNLALFHLYTHAMFKALLFLAAGTILMSSFGNQDIRLLGGVGMSMPYTMIMFNISSLCLIGGPFLSAFYSKHVILEMMLDSSVNLVSVAIMMVATFFTANYVFATLKAISWIKPIIPMLTNSSSSYTYLPLGILGIGGVVSGKLFSSLDIFNMECPCNSFFWFSLINLMTLTGVVVGITKKDLKAKSFWLSSLFHLSPSLNSNIFYYSKEMKYLDYGWLEMPGSIQPHIMGLSLTKFFAWPKNQSFITMLLGSVLIILLMQT